MDKSALFKLSYGLFLAGTEYEGKKNACVINTAAQATSEPAQMIVTMLKSNYTTELIEKKGSLTVSVLSQATPLSLIQDFGMRSGRSCDKFEKYSYQTDAFGNPYLTDTMVAWMSLKVTQTIDLGTHNLFICTVEDAGNLDSDTPITYADYRILKNGGTLSKAAKAEEAEAAPQEQAPQKHYVCSVCHYEYDGEIPFEELPDSYVCPVCKMGKNMFEAV